MHKSETHSRYQPALPTITLNSSNSILTITLDSPNSTNRKTKTVRTASQSKVHSTMRWLWLLIHLYRFVYFYVMCMSILVAGHACVREVPRRSEEGTWSCGTGVTDGCQLPTRCLGAKPGSWARVINTHNHQAYQVLNLEETQSK